MSDAYKAEVAELRAHAQTLADVEGQLRAALATARQGDIAATAYGQQGADAAAALKQLADSFRQAMADGLEVLDTSTSDMVRTASAYEVRESTTASTFT
jgi:hypothetical protein